jgi:hypothetical protein
MKAYAFFVLAYIVAGSVGCVHNKNIGSKRLETAAYPTMPVQSANIKQPAIPSIIPAGFTQMPSSMQDKAGGGDVDYAELIVEVKGVKPIGYYLRVYTSPDREYPRYVLTALDLAPWNAAGTGSGVIWTDPGHWDWEIFKVADVDLHTLKKRDAAWLIFNGPSEPTLLTIKSETGKIQIVEAYTQKPPR